MNNKHRGNDRTTHRGKRQAPTSTTTRCMGWSVNIVCCERLNRWQNETGQAVPSCRVATATQMRQSTVGTMRTVGVST